LAMSLTGILPMGCRFFGCFFSILEQDSNNRQDTGKMPMLQVLYPNPIAWPIWKTPHATTQPSAVR
jgi:hypothetical protein